MLFTNLQAYFVVYYNYHLVYNPVICGLQIRVIEFCSSQIQSNVSATADAINNVIQTSVKAN